MSEEQQTKTPKSEAAKAAGRRNLAAGWEATEGRGATKHGVFTVICSDGAQAPAVSGAAAIASDVDGVLEQIATDLGGDLTGAQQEILRACRVPMIVLRLAEAYMLKNDVVDRKGRPHGLLRVVGVYNNALRHNLVALGLERRARDAGTLETYIDEKYSGRRTEEVKPDEPVTKQTE